MTSHDAIMVCIPGQSRDLTDAQWAFLHSLNPEPKRRKDDWGRPWRPRRDVPNGVLYILLTGAPWADLADRYLPHQTCQRGSQQQNNGARPRCPRGHGDIVAWRRFMAPFYGARSALGGRMFPRSAYSDYPSAHTSWRPLRHPVRPVP
jgi:transposase